MNPRSCPRCGADVVGTPELPLDATPHELGIHAADGRKLTIQEHLDAIRAHKLIGHHAHRCPPKSDPQLAFDI